MNNKIKYELDYGVDYSDYSDDNSVNSDDNENKDDIFFSSKIFNFPEGTISEYDFYENILSQLRELCCDEYYEYFEFIDIKLIKSISTFLGKNILVDLLFGCGVNNSIKSFEYLIKKFDIIINSYFEIDINSIKKTYEHLFEYDNDPIYYKIIGTYGKNDSVRYWKSNFKKYVFEHYQLKQCQLILLVKDLYWDRDLELIKNIYSKFDISGNKVFKKLFGELKSQIQDSYLQNQYEVAKFLTEFYKELIDKQNILDIMKNIFLSNYIRRKKIYTKKNRNKVLNFLFDTFHNIIDDKMINSVMINCVDIEILKWIETKKINVEISTWFQILASLLGLSNCINFDSFDNFDIFDVFYYVVKKILNYNNDVYNNKNTINWNNLYDKYKFKNNVLINYLIETELIEIKFELDNNAFLIHKNYYDLLQNKKIFKERKKFIEYYYSFYEKKLLKQQKLSSKYKQIIL